MEGTSTSRCFSLSQEPPGDLLFLNTHYPERSERRGKGRARAGMTVRGLPSLASCPHGLHSHLGVESSFSHIQFHLIPKLGWQRQHTSCPPQFYRVPEGVVPGPRINWKGDLFSDDMRWPPLLPFAQSQLRLCWCHSRGRWECLQFQGLQDCCYLGSSRR